MILGKPLVEKSSFMADVVNMLNLRYVWRPSPAAGSVNAHGDDAAASASASLGGSASPVIVDPKGHVIDLGRRSRVFRGAARDTLFISENECTGPGCGARHRGLQCDHLKPWEHFGHTDQDNGGIDCGPCNRTKHTKRFTVHRDETGWHYIRPDGTEIAPRGQPHAPPNAA